MWRVRVTLAAPAGGDVRAEGDRLMEVLVLESILLPWLDGVVVEDDGDEGTVTPDATVVAGSAEQAEALLTGLVRGMTSWAVVGVTSEAA
jgi:hypothetical protein